MSQLEPRANSSESLSPGWLMSASLPVLLREADAELVDMHIEDSSFLGAAVEHRGGLMLALSASLGAMERDRLARCLLGHVLGLNRAPLPEALRIERR